MIALGILDQSPIASGQTAADAIRSTIELAQKAEQLGYRRYWLAEHHSSASLAGSTPEILITRVAAATSSIRVGSGGVMLSHYSALKVAENFRMLDTLFPNRIDLGIGRAPGSDRRTAQALAHGPGALGIEHFGQQLRDLRDYLENDLPADHPFAGIKAMPEGPGMPEIWLLGSSDQSAAYAAQMGFAFSFAQFINPQGGPAVMEAYREYFTPSPELAMPRGSIGISVICGETTADAERLASSIDLWRLRNESGRPGPVPSPEEAAAHPYTQIERIRIQQNRGRAVVGNPDEVREKLTEIAERYKVDEVMVVTICHEHAARVRSYELLAEAFELGKSGAAEPRGSPG